MNNLKQHVAVVTGAASGIGLAVTEAFAGEGMCIVMADVIGDALAGQHVETSRESLPVWWAPAEVEYRLLLTGPLPSRSHEGADPPETVRTP